MADLTFEIARISEIENTARVALSGAIDASTVITFQSELDKLKKDGIRKFLLDMAGIRYVNSTGLGSLVKLADGLESEGGMIALMQIHPKVKVVFDMLGLNAFFKIFKSDDEAMTFFRESDGAPPAMEEPEPPPPVEEPVPVLETPEEADIMSEQPLPPAPVAAPEPAAPAPQAFSTPSQVACQECGVLLRISHTGDFRCPRCFTVLHAASEKDVEFRQRRKDIPFQVTLTGEDAHVDGLLECVAAIAKKSGLSDGDAATLKGAVADTCRNITSLAYGGNKKMSFQVLLEAGSGEILLRFADHGNLFDVASADFQSVKTAVSDVTHVPHPKGGNLVRMVKKI